jgi:hypothetical protein
MGRVKKGGQSDVTNPLFKSSIMSDKMQQPMWDAESKDHSPNNEAGTTHAPKNPKNKHHKAIKLNRHK